VLAAPGDGALDPEGEEQHRDRPEGDQELVVGDGEEVGHARMIRVRAVVRQRG
jgi:hypothetical protein